MVLISLPSCSFDKPLNVYFADCAGSWLQRRIQDGYLTGQKQGTSPTCHLCDVQAYLPTDTFLPELYFKHPAPVKVIYTLEQFQNIQGHASKVTLENFREQTLQFRHHPMKLMGKVRPSAEKDSKDRMGSQVFLIITPHHFPIYVILMKVLEMLRCKGL